MANYQLKKIASHTKRWKQPKQKFEEAEQTSEPDSDTVGMLGLSDQEYETAMITMPRALMDKVDRIWKHTAV